VIKKELVYLTTFKTRQQAYDSINSYIELDTIASVFILQSVT